MDGGGGGAPRAPAAVGGAAAHQPSRGKWFCYRFVNQMDEAFSITAHRLF